jgi:hypothetical protein
MQHVAVQLFCSFTKPDSLLCKRNLKLLILGQTEDIRFAKKVFFIRGQGKINFSGTALRTLCTIIKKLIVLCTNFIEHH